MFREELRLHRSFVGSIGSGFFPVMIFILSVVLAVTFSRFKGIDVPTVLLMLHASSVLYGLGVGALGRIGEQVMTRRLGQVNFLLALPSLQPVSFSRVMAIFYLKDATFYILYAIVPIIGGIAVGAPFANASLTSVGLLGLTLFLAFMLGMSLSFLASTVSTRSRAVSLAGLLAVLGLVALVWPLKILTAGQILPPLGFWADKSPWFLLISATLAFLLSAAAVLLTKERFEAPIRTYGSALLPMERRFSFSGPSKTLVAKEWLELRRSGALGAVVGGFLGPLLAIYMLAWIFRTGIGVPIEFNGVFYGGMVGFLGVMVYSWLTNIETNEFMNVQPVSLDRVIKAKLVLYFLLTSIISCTYVIIMGILNGQADLVPLSLLVAIATTFYVAGVTARLTGLWTNTMLFDVRVLAKFGGAVIPPLVIVAILSFLVRSNPLLAWVLLVIESLILLVASRFLLRAVGTTWKRAVFSPTGPTMAYSVGKRRNKPAVPQTPE
jgi:hypothetical protein